MFVSRLVGTGRQTLVYCENKVFFTAGPSPSSPKTLLYKEPANKKHHSLACFSPSLSVQRGQVAASFSGLPPPVRAVQQQAVFLCSQLGAQDQNSGPYACPVGSLSVELLPPSSNQHFWVRIIYMDKWIFILFFKYFILYLYKNRDVVLSTSQTGEDCRIIQWLKQTLFSF